MAKKNLECPLSFYYWIHSRIFKQTFRGYINNKQLGVALRMQFNIPKRVCPLIIKELEILGLIQRKDGYFKVKKAKEDLVLKKLENRLLYQNM